MPRKLRQLRADLEAAGAFIKTQEGSHQKWAHPQTSAIMIIKGFSPSANRRVSTLAVRRRGFSREPVSIDDTLLFFLIQSYFVGYFNSPFASSL